MNGTPKNEGLPRRGFFRRLFSWRAMRRTLIGLTVLVTLIGLGVTEENWRGKHDWETYRHDQEAKGERFDWQAFVPAAVPTDQNFFMAPVFTKIIYGNIHLDPYPKPDNNYNYTIGDWRKNLVTDLKPWQRAYREIGENSVGVRFPVSPQAQAPANDILLALSIYAPLVEELRRASERPYANIPLPYDGNISTVAGVLLPYLATLKQCTQVLEMRAVAELVAGQNQKALDDIKLLLYLSNSMRNPQLLISLLVRMAVINIELQPVWEGMAEHKWSEEQLAELETELSKIDFLNDYETAIRCERAFAIKFFEKQRSHHEVVLPKQDGSTETIDLAWMPSAFFYQNELAFARAYQEWLLVLIDIHSRVISPETWRRVGVAINAAEKHYSLYTVEANMTVKTLDSAPRIIAFEQTGVDLARVACALERYRLAHGQYPVSLDGLAPQYIAQVPHDVINGQPLHYRLRPDGQFVLYSVGWNETDDGGLVVSKSNSATVDRDKGDWVWQYPVKH